MSTGLRLSLCLLAALLPARAQAQEAGQYRIGLTFGLPSNTGLAVRYYLADGVGVELHGLVFGLIHTGAWLGAGGAVYVYPQADQPFYAVANASWMVFGHGGGPYGGTPVDAKRLDFGLGLGAEARSRDGYGYAALGPNINIFRTKRIQGPDGLLMDGSTDRRGLSLYTNLGFGGRKPD